MRLTDILLTEHIILPLKTNQRDEAIKELIVMLAEKDLITDTEQAYAAVLEREKLMTTGVGNGIGIPHCKDKSCPNFAVAMGIQPKGIKFESIDKKDVKVVFLLVGPENNPGMHIKLLSRISRLMSNEELRQSILKSKDAQKIHDLIDDEENYYFDID